jgi:hypothetical protein
LQPLVRAALGAGHDPTGWLTAGSLE